jgi:predicted Zn-dependent protease
MKKTILQAFILLSLAAGIYLLISRVNWMKLFRIEKMTDALEQKLGDMVWAGMEEQSIDEGKEYDRVDSLVTAICKSNGFNRDKIKLHIMGDSEVNAFALPDRHMVVHTGLINAVHNNDELSGVLAHEIAHMELSHVMKKLLKQMGYTLLISITTGEAGGGAIKELLGMLSSTAYDRKLEKDADIKAIEYLKKTGISPNGFADFLYRLGEKDGSMGSLSWISTHPDSKERAKYIREKAGQ